MEWNKQRLRNILLVVCGAVAFYAALQNLGAVANGLQWLVGILSPFLAGGVIAFVLNVPMRAIERHLLPKAKRLQKLRRPLALILTLFAVIGVLTLAGLVIGPGIAEACMTIADQIPGALRRLETYLAQLDGYWPQLEAMLTEVVLEDWQSISQKAIDLLQTWGKSLLSSGGGLLGGVVSGVMTFVIGLIFAIYLLFQKEKLAQQGWQVLYALPLVWGFIRHTFPLRSFCASMES